ncbi:Mll2356 protein [hydrothermal vent metagenome]|uniref:Mll2356 protein n=1 Tax=hydrothermal vent metagenome TaxID=652676 RepID=A0A3B0XXC6_9ZZZZ
MENEIIEVVEEKDISESDVDSIEQISKQTTPLDGVVIGVLMSFSEAGLPLVAFPGNQSKTGIVAHSTTVFKPEDAGCQVALLFEGGDPQRPVVIGRIQHPEEIIKPNRQNTSAELDGERLEFSAEKEIVFRCGKASITLTRAGKVILRGKYLLSRSSGVNRIKGGSVQIN